MNALRRSLMVLLLAVFLCLPDFSSAVDKDRNKTAPSQLKPLDIVFCLDLSGSTNGLLNDLRDHLWMIINLANNMEPKPYLRLGVVGFSRPSFGKENAYVKVLVPLTTNFDYLSEELYRLRPSIEKGDQIVAAALRASVMDMKWSDRSDAVKLVFLVGNGMVSGTDHEYVRYCEQAREKNIVIHPVYVMKSSNWFKELPSWRRIATMTGGMQTEVTINKPDNMQVFVSVKKDLTALNNKINATYNWAGVDSAICRRSLTAADSGAFYADSRDAFYNRLYYKSGEEYAEVYRDCDIVSNAVLLTGEAAAENEDGAFRDRMKEMYSARELMRAQLRKEFLKADLDAMQRAYLTGSIDNAGVLRRCILNILYKAWGMR